MMIGTPFYRYAHRIWSGIGGLACSLLMFASIGHAASNESHSLRISTWPGAYKQAQERAIFTPFRKIRGTKIKVSTQVSTQGGVLKLLKSWYDKGKAPYDVIDLSAHAAEVACEAGHLMPLSIDNIELGANDEPAEQDFIGNSLIDCAIPTAAWSGLLVVDNKAFSKKKPHSWADFFNVKKFPGKRGLKKSARYSMEMALLADGVEAGEIYYTLETRSGRKRALDKLNSLNNNIVWWQTGREAVEVIKRDKVVMGMAFNGRLFDAIVTDGLDVSLIWQGQIYDVDYWAIPRHAKARREALKFIEFATAPKQLAAQAKWIAYGPMRHSSLQFVGNHGLVNLHMGPYLPTTKTHFLRALKFSEAWWRTEAGKLAAAQFQSWMNGTLDLKDDKLWSDDEQ